MSTAPGLASDLTQTYINNAKPDDDVYSEAPMQNSSCRDCAYGTYGNCKLLSSGICMNPERGTSQCFHGTVTCANTAEMVFDYDYDLIKASPVGEALFKSKLRSTVAHLLQTSRSVVAGMHLTDGSVVVAIEFVRAEYAEKTDSLTQSCKMCIAHEGERLCAHSRAQAPCLPPLACSPNPCLNGGVCLSKNSAGPILEANASRQLQMYSCVCPLDTVGPTCSRVVTAPSDTGFAQNSQDDGLGSIARIAIICAIIVCGGIGLMAAYFIMARGCREDPRHRAKMEAIYGKGSHPDVNDEMAWDDPFTRMGPALYAPGGPGSQRQNALARSLHSMQSSKSLPSWASGSNAGKQGWGGISSPDRYMSSPGNGTPLTSPLVDPMSPSGTVEYRAGPSSGSRFNEKSISDVYASALGKHARGNQFSPTQEDMYEFVGDERLNSEQYRESVYGLATQNNGVGLDDMEQELHEGLYDPATFLNEHLRKKVCEKKCRQASYVGIFTRAWILMARATAWTTARTTWTE